jgi:hypothetical protein
MSYKLKVATSIHVSGAYLTAIATFLSEGITVSASFEIVPFVWGPLPLFQPSQDMRIQSGRHFK